MNTQDFEILIKNASKEIESYINFRFPSQAGDTALRFIDGNFRAQGWQGSSFMPWKANKRNGRVLVKTGHLRSASYYVTAPGMVTIRNTMPYAKIHNEGGDITVPVTKQMKKFAWAMFYKESGKGIKTNKKTGAKFQSVDVGERANKWRALALTKKTFLNIHIEQRQFAPTETSPSPVLNNAITRKIEQELQKIFKSM